MKQMEKNIPSRNFKLICEYYKDILNTWNCVGRKGKSNALKDLKIRLKERPTLAELTALKMTLEDAPLYLKHENEFVRDIALLLLKRSQS